MAGRPGRARHARPADAGRLDAVQPSAVASAPAAVTIPAAPASLREETCRMCQRVQGEKCGKASWVGCGQHADQVMRGVPPEKRCTCPRTKSVLSRLLGR